LVEEAAVIASGLGAPMLEEIARFIIARES
jgi:hypothetical protein